MQPPPATPEDGAATAKERVSRANYTQMLAQEENFVKANAVRAESERRKAEMKAQRERFRQRGQMLRAQREEGQAQIRTALSGCHDDALRLGTEARTQRERLRKEHSEQQAHWKEHGKGLTQQHEQLRERLKASAEESKAERQKETQLLRSTLKRLNQQVDDSILAQNQALAMRVRNETSADAIRASKQTFVDDRWRKADDLRESLAIMHTRHQRQEQEYIDTAHMIKAHAKLHSDAAKLEREAERRQLVIETREYEKRMEAQVKAARDRVIADKRAVHDTLEESKLVPEGGLPGVEDPEAGPLQMFTRFFGFRKRGHGHSLSSMVPPAV